MPFASGSNNSQSCVGHITQSFHCRISIFLRSCPDYVDAYPLSLNSCLSPRKQAWICKHTPSSPLPVQAVHPDETHTLYIALAKILRDGEDPRRGRPRTRKVSPLPRQGRVCSHSPRRHAFPGPATPHPGRAPLLAKLRFSGDELLARRECPLR